MCVLGCECVCVLGCECMCVCVSVCVQTHAGGVGGVRVVLQDSGQAEVRHLTHQVAVDQDVACSQVPVDVAQVCQVGHASCNATQHAHQLDDGELTIVPLDKSKRGSQRLKDFFG